MDKRSRVGCRLEKPVSLLNELRDGSISFDDFEKRFNDAIKADIEFAGTLAEGLKRGRFSFTPLEDARKRCLIGYFSESRSQHKLAIKWTLSSLVAFRQLGYRPGVHQCLRILLASHAHLGRYTYARFYAGQALADSRLPDGERVKIHINLGGLAYRKHDYVPALECYKAALILLERGANDKMKSIVVYNLGLLYVCLNKFAEAEENFAQASELFRTFQQDLFHAHTLQSSGNLYTILGQYFHAENKLKEARSLYLEGGDHTGAVLCDLELLRLDARLNRYERILDRIPDLINAFRKKGRASEIGQIYYHGVLSALAQRENELAEEYLHQATRIFKKEKSQHYQALCTMIGGVLLFRMNHHSRGLAHIIKARQIFADTGMHELELECLIYKNRLHGTDDEGTFHRVRHLLKNPLSPIVRTQGLILLHYYWARRGQIKRSITSLFEAVNIIEESRASILSSSIRASFFEDKAEIYELLIERLLQWKNPSASSLIFRTMELSRSRQMMELLSQRKDLPPVINRDEPLVMELHRHDLRLKQLNRKLEQLGQASGVEVEKNALLNAMAESRTEITNIRRKLSHEDRLSLFYPVEFRPEDIMSLLRPGKLLVIFFQGQKTLSRIELDHRRISTYHFPLPEFFKRDFNQLINILANRILPKMKHALLIAEQLSSIMVPRRLKGVEHITFILHKTLQRFPLALLKKQGRLLIEDYTINQCPNLPVFYFCQRSSPPRFERPVFFFSEREDDPTAPERHALLKLYPQAKVIASLADPDVANCLKTGDFIHFAGHCFFNKRNPEDSYLQLGGHRISLTSFGRYALDAHPFFNLAACHSGWTALSGGNEPRGFVIGSFAAGATSLLAGLWDLDDEVTGSWMDAFYKHMHLGLPVAYQQACLTIMIRERDDPYLWAGFSLMGRA